MLFLPLLNNFVPLLVPRRVVEALALIIYIFTLVSASLLSLSKKRPLDCNKDALEPTWSAKCRADFRMLVCRIFLSY